jgi:hypothetical protein
VTVSTSGKSVSGRRASQGRDVGRVRVSTPRRV